MFRRDILLSSLADRQQRTVLAISMVEFYCNVSTVLQCHSKQLQCLAFVFRMETTRSEAPVSPSSDHQSRPQLGPKKSCLATVCDYFGMPSDRVPSEIIEVSQKCCQGKSLIVAPTDMPGSCTTVNLSSKFTFVRRRALPISYAICWTL